MYTEIHVDTSYFNRDTKQSHATRQNAKNTKLLVLTSVQLKMCLIGALPIL